MFQRSESIPRSTRGSTQGESLSSTAPPVDAFAGMRAAASLAISTNLDHRDTCLRLTPSYNDNYNPLKPPPASLPSNYSPYAPGEPLHDDRFIDTSKLRRGHTHAGAGRLRTSWTWKLGYAVVNNDKKTSKGQHPLMWVCKLCGYYNGVDYNTIATAPI